MKALQRAWILYLLTVTLTLTFASLSLYLNLWWAFTVTASNVSDFLVGVLTLHRTYYLTDVLLLYTLLVLGAVPVLVLLAHGYTTAVLAVSWGLWALWQLAPQHAAFPWPIADNSVFNFPAWQVLFVTALATGYHHQELKPYLARLSPYQVLGISAVLVAGAIALYAATQPASATHSAMLIQQLFGKVDLRIGRLFVFAAFFTFAYALLTVAWRPIYRAFSWLLLPLGQNALTAYTLHLFVVALTTTASPFLLMTVPATAAQNTMIQIGGVILIWAIILLQPYAFAVLHTWFAMVTALVPVKRASWELSSQPRNP